MKLLLSLLVGTIVGILMTIPLGPTSIYVAQQSMGGQTRKGIHVAMGSVIIDILYCLVITLGLISLIAPWLQNQWVQFGLSLFLIVYGMKMLFFDVKGVASADGSGAAREVQDAAAPKQVVGDQSGRPMASRRRNWGVLLGTVMALSNPTLFVSWTAVLGFLSANALLPNLFWNKIVFSLATGLGSFMWFLGLALFVRRKRHQISPLFVRRAGALTALVIIGFGVYFTITILQHLTHA